MKNKYEKNTKNNDCAHCARVYHNDACDYCVNSSHLIELKSSEPIHDWFELSYAQYLTIPRSVLQSMPTELQERFTTCLDELDETIDWRPKEGCYWVQLRDDKGRYKRSINGL